MTQDTSTDTGNVRHGGLQNSRKRDKYTYIMFVCKYVMTIVVNQLFIIKNKILNIGIGINTDDLIISELAIVKLIASII